MSKRDGLFVFIDAENMRKAVRECGYQKIDYRKLYKWLTETKGAKRVYLYAGYIEDDEAEKRKFESLEKLGYILRLKEVQKYPATEQPFQVTCENCKHVNHRVRKIEGRSKANCDSELTLDVINQGSRGRYSEIIVFSGDGDFSKMYEYVSKDMKRKVLVFSPMQLWPARLRTSQKLRELDSDGCLSLQPLETILPKFAAKNKTGLRR